MALAMLPQRVSLLLNGMGLHLLRILDGADAFELDAQLDARADHVAIGFHVEVETIEISRGGESGVGLECVGISAVTADGDLDINLALEHAGPELPLPAAAV